MSTVLKCVLAGLIVFSASYLFINNKSTVDTSRVSANNESLNSSIVPTKQLLDSPEEFKGTSWQEFSPPSGLFKVLLPAVPQHIVDEILDAKTREHHKYQTFISSSEDGSVFMISAIKHPRKLEDEHLETVLKDSVQEMISRNKSNVLKDMHFEQFQGHQSMDFSLVNGEMFVSGKVFTYDDTLFILSMINRSNSFNKEELAYFIHSFTFIKK